ncbi:hypothetical protein DV735_g887, partial [Chaetothyriales sp. CBS 134920]
MALPPFLLIEVRAAFQACARQNAVQTCARQHAFQKASRHSFTLAKVRFLHTRPAHRLPAGRPTTNVPEAQRSNGRNTNAAQNGESSTQLTPRKEKNNALDTDRSVDVPLRVIPPAKLSPSTKLLPQERLHIEHLTRHPPTKKKMPGFRESLLVYHLGNFRIWWIIFLRIFTTTTACTMATIWMPAYYQWGAPWWVLAGGGLVALLPPWMVFYWFRGFVTEIRLKLPPSARESAKTAMNYARNLPRDATIEARFHYWTSLPGVAKMKIGDTVPVSNKFNIPPVTFRWLNEGATETSIAITAPAMSDDSPQDADAPASTSTGAPTLTRRDIEVLIAGFRAFKGSPEVDNAQLTTALGLSNPRSGTNAWRNLTKKILGDQVPSLPPLSKDGSPRARATKAPKKSTSLTTAPPSTGASENVASPEPVTPANPGIGSSFQSKCKEASSAATPATPAMSDDAAKAPTISEPSTPTPAPRAAAAGGMIKSGSGSGSDEDTTSPAIALAGQEAKPAKKARKTPATKQAKGKQANSETGGGGSGPDDNKPAPSKKRKAPAKKAAKAAATTTTTSDNNDAEATTAAVTTVGASAATTAFSLEKAKAEARKEQIDRAVEEANAENGAAVEALLDLNSVNHRNDI